MHATKSSRTEAAMEDFSGFYTEHFGRIAAQLHAYLGDRWEAQDLTQEAFCRAFDRWDRISRYERPESWVRQVAWNLATNRLRQLRVAWRHLAGQRQEHTEGPSPDRVALVRALAALPPRHRLAIVLNGLAGLSISEIAAQQGVAEGTVRSWLSRGRARLAEQLTEAPTSWETLATPELDFSRVQQRRAIRRGVLAGVVVLRWNLRTGAVNTVAQVDQAGGVTPQGWVVGTKGDKVVLDMDGSHIELPPVSEVPPIRNPGMFSVSDDGRVIGGMNRTLREGRAAIGWTCS